MGDIVTLARLGDPDTGAEARAVLGHDRDVAREIHLGRRSAQASHERTWLTSLDDVEFLAETGRPRQ